jgi:hypothetical protein
MIDRDRILIGDVGDDRREGVDANTLSKAMGCELQLGDL